MLSIMAGNPKVEIRKNGRIKIDPQLTAFEAALHLASERREQIGRIYVAFDHTGQFRDHFLRKNISQEEPSLADCMTGITDTYRPIAEKYETSLDDIGIITEEYARATMLALQPTLAFPFNRVAGVMTKPLCEKECHPGEQIEEPDDRVKITCKGITAAIIERLARKGDDIELFWEFNRV